MARIYRRGSLTTIWLVRHGETLFNRNGVIPGSNDDPELTSLGRTACNRLRLLMDEVLSVKDQLILASPARRAMETARLGCGPGARILVDCDLREVSVGSGSNSDPLFAELHTDLVLDWCQRNRLHVRPPGGESGNDVIERIESARARISALAPETVVVFSHFALIKVWLSLFSAPGVAIDRQRPKLLDACVIPSSSSSSRSIKWHEHPGDPRQPDNTHRH